MVKLEKIVRNCFKSVKRFERPIENSFVFSSEILSHDTSTVDEFGAGPQRREGVGGHSPLPSFPKQ